MRHASEGWHLHGTQHPNARRPDLHHDEQAGWVLYTGVTADLAARITQSTSRESGNRFFDLEALKILSREPFLSGEAIPPCRERLWHREGRGAQFCRRYGPTRLVFAERHEDIEEAIAREKAIKAWQRAWKVRLIEEQNPEWDELFELLNA